MRRDFPFFFEMGISGKYVCLIYTLAARKKPAWLIVLNGNTSFKRGQAMQHAALKRGIKRIQPFIYFIDRLVYVSPLPPLLFLLMMIAGLELYFFTYTLEGENR